MWGSCGVGELRCAGVAVWGSCGIEELRCGEVAVWGSCGMGESRYEGVVVWGSHHKRLALGFVIPEASRYLMYNHTR